MNNPKPPYVDNPFLFFGFLTLCAVFVNCTIYLFWVHFAKWLHP